MSFDAQEHDIDALYEQNPDEITAAVIQAAANSAAAELAALHNTRLEEDYARVRAGQTESSSLVAQGELEAKYGKAEFERLLPKLTQTLEESPHLVSQEAFTSPVALTKALDQVMQLAKLEADREHDANEWQRIKGESKNIYVSNGPLG